VRGSRCFTGRTLGELSQADTEYARDIFGLLTVARVVFLLKRGLWTMDKPKTLPPLSIAISLTNAEAEVLLTRRQEV
jgi:hypothetical protein